MRFTKDPWRIKNIGDATVLKVRATGIPYIFVACIVVNKKYFVIVFITFSIYHTCSHNRLIDSSTNLQRSKMETLL